MNIAESLAAALLSAPVAGAASNTININLATDTDGNNLDARALKNEATELTDGVTDDDQLEGQEIDIAKSKSP